MFYLPLSLKAWGTLSFDDVLKHEMCLLEADMLPLQQGLQYSSYAITDKLSITVLNKEDDENKIIVKVGLFYNGIIAGCSCADDPTPTDETNEYCDVLITIDKQSAAAEARLIP